jgi:cyclin-dependent kinase 9
MQGNTEQHQLTLIAQLCGAICPEVWPGVEQLDLYTKMEIPKMPKRRVKERLRPYVKDQWAVDLLDRLLTLNPAARIDSDTALNHDFFWTDPMPISLEKMLSQHTQSMFEFLAPVRRGGAGHHARGGPGPPAGGGAHIPPGAKGARGPGHAGGPTDGYVDRVF